MKDIIDTAKSINPYIITAVGGGIITAEPDIAMRALENADYGMVGEGEITINELAYTLETEGDPRNVPGVIVKGRSEFIPRAEIMNLDCIPFPDYDGFNYAESFLQGYSRTTIKKETGAVIITSRSCPYNCTFCFHSSGKHYRRRSLDKVFLELDMLKERFPLDYVQIADELFGNDIEYVREFARRIKPYGIKYLINTRLDRISDELLGILSDSGCEEILFGIEHVCDTVLESMQKKTKASIIEPTLRKCLKYGIRPIGNIIFGDVAETEDTMEEALEWWRYNHHLGSITTTYLIVFPGSSIYKKARERGIINDPVQFLKDGCPLVNMTSMDDSQWQTMKNRVAFYRILYEDKPDIDIRQIKKSLGEIAEKYDSCVWPATNDSIRFFREMSDRFYKRTTFVNIDTDSQMLRDIGSQQQVFSPEIIEEKNLQVVVCPRKAFVEDIRKICFEKYPSVWGVVDIEDLSTGIWRGYIPLEKREDSIV